MPPPRKITAPSKKSGGASGRASMSLPNAGFPGANFMPNFGVDIPMEINMKPALTNLGAPSRPSKPTSGGRKLTKTSNGVGVKQVGGMKAAALPFGAIPAPGTLSTPAAPGQRSKAGIPPPPSHGKRSVSKASNNSVKLGSLTGTISPGLQKSQPLPKITKGKSSKSQPESSCLSDIEMVLFGHISSDLPELPSRNVRVFLSSTFSDMKAERNEIWTSVYPAVRTHCLAHELDFSFVDMRWGVLDFATDHHKTEEIVLSEARRTIKSSAATSFLSIIGQRYGSVVNDSTIPQEKFEILIKAAKEKKLTDTNLLEKWFRKDENNIPPVYVLQTISSLLPDYNSPDKNKSDAASADWNKISSRLWEVTYAATKQAVANGQLDQTEVDHVEKSVTTTEIETGILNNPTGAGTTYSIYRCQHGVEQDIEHPKTYKFIDIDYSGDKPAVNKSNLEKIEKYIVGPVKEALMPESRKAYEVKWHTGGIPQDIKSQTEDQRKYLSTLTSDLTDYLTKSVDLHLESIRNQPKEYEPNLSTDSNPSSNKSSDKHVCTQECIMKCALANKNALMAEYKSMERAKCICLPASDYKEILHHLNLAEIKTRLFCGRKTQLASVKTYMAENLWSSPLMIGGASGGGKTPFAGQVAKMSHKWLGESAVVAVRFFGSSIQAEQIHPALRNIIKQLACAYQVPMRASTNDSLKTLSHKLDKLLHAISFMGNGQRPCVIVLDGLEHLNNSYNTHYLTWIPTKLPPHVYMICTYNGTQNDLEKIVKARFDRHLELPTMTTDDMMEYIDLSLSHIGRRIGGEQRQCIEQGLKANPQPVFAQLLVNLAKECESYTDIAHQVPHNTESAVNALIDGLEQKYGKTFVRYSLAYLTLGHMGISEAELEDVLSVSDEVLVEVYVYHEPPTPGRVRIPPHLWPMLRKELDQFIVEVSAMDYQLLTWYHGAVEHAVCKRYLCDKEQVKEYHKHLAEIYTSHGGVQRTITLSRLRTPLTIENADRGIACYAQTDKLPVRLIYSIIHHLSKVADMSTLKSKTICNLGYISVVWKKIDLRSMSKITTLTMSGCPDGSCKEDPEIKLMLDFYEHHTLYVTGKAFSAEALVDLCVIIVGSFTRSEATPRINNLIDQAHKKIDEWTGALLVPTNQCKFFKQDQLRWHSSGYKSVAHTDNNNTMISLCTESSQSVDSVDLNSFDTVSLTRKTSIKQVKLSQRRVFALTDKSVVIQSLGASDSDRSVSTVGTDSISKGELLNQMIAVSDSGRYFCLGGKERLGVFEDKAQFTATPNYKGISTLGLGGVKSTDAIVFTPDERHTISAHTIPAKGKNIGGIVKWLHESKSTEARVSVPSPVLKGCLFLLPEEEDTLLCACNHNEILKVSLKSQKIIDKPYSGSVCWTKMSVDGSILGLIFEDSKVKVWNLAEKKFAELHTTQTPISLSVVEVSSTAYIGTKQGTIEIFSIREMKLLKSLQISSASIIELSVVAELYLVAIDELNDVYTLCTDVILEKSEEDNDQTVNSLGESSRGVFSRDCSTLLVERSIEEPISVYSTADLTKVDVSATNGSRDIIFCGDTTYLVGCKEHSIKVWDLGQGQEVTPPAPVVDLCTNYEAYCASPREPAVVFANEGILTEWTIGSPNVKSMPYTGLNVAKITFSQALTVIALRSGTRENDSWIVHLLERSSGDTLVSHEADEKVSDIACNTHCAILLRCGTAFYMSAKSREVSEVQLSAAAQHIATSDNYHIIHYSGEINLYNSATGAKIGQVDIGQKVTSIVYFTDKYAVVGMPLGIIQLIKWQTSAGGTKPAVIQSNMIQTTCNHLSACVNKSSDTLYVYGRLLNESRIFSFALKNI